MRIRVFKPAMYTSVVGAFVMIIISVAGLTTKGKQKQLEMEPVLCTIEEIGIITGSIDIIELAEEMASQRLHQVSNFSINRTSVAPDDIFDFTTRGCMLLSPDCAAIITIATCPVVLALDHWTNQHSIPHLIFAPEHEACHVTSSTSLQLAPSVQIKSDIIRILIEFVWDWKELVFVYDQFLDSNELSQLQGALSAMSVSTGFFNINGGITDELVQDVINATKVMRHVFLAVNMPEMNQILNVVAQYSLLTQEYQWVAMSNTSCFGALNNTLLKGSNVLFLMKTHTTQTDGDCRPEVVEDVIGENRSVSQSHLLSVGIEVIIKGILSVDLLQDIEKSSTMCTKKLYARRRLAMKEAKRLTVRTAEGEVMFDAQNGLISSYGFKFCSTDDSSEYGFSSVGSWSPATTLQADKSVFRNAFKDFGGRKLLIGSQEAPPFVMKKREGGRTVFTGFCIELLTELANRLKFTYEIVEPPDKMWGAPLDNGSWNGIVGMVMRGDIDFGIGPFTITSSRATVIDFTTPYLEDGIGILTKRPELNSQAMFRLFTPLQPVVWACLGGSIVGVAIILYIVNRLSPFSSRRYSKIGQDRLTLFTCVWTILASTMDQGSDIHPKSSSGRLILGFWWLFTIILISTYTANMAAVLTITIYDKPINSLSELAGQSEIMPLVKTGSNIHTLFKEATNEIYKSIWKMMSNMPVVTSNEEALKYVKSQDIVYMTDRSQLEYIVLNDCETYALADDVFNTGGMGFILPKNAAFLTVFDIIIMKLQESGIIDGWRRQWWNIEGSKCSGNDRISTVNQLDLQYLAGPFFIFLGASVLSILVVIVERTCMTNRCKRLRGRTRQQDVSQTIHVEAPPDGNTAVR